MIRDPRKAAAARQARVEVVTARAARERVVVAAAVKVQATVVVVGMAVGAVWGCEAEVAMVAVWYHHHHLSRLDRLQQL